MIKLNHKKIAFWCFPEKKISVYNQPRTMDFPSWSLWPKLFHIDHFYGGHILHNSHALFAEKEVVIMLMDNEMDKYVEWLKGLGKKVLLLEEMSYGANLVSGHDYDYSLRNCDGILPYNPESQEYYNFYNKTALLPMPIADSYIHEYQQFKKPFSSKSSDTVFCGACYPNDVYNRMFHQTIDLIEKAGYKPAVVLRTSNPSDSDKKILERCQLIPYDEDYHAFRRTISNFRCVVYIDNLATVGRMPLVSALSGTVCCTNYNGYYGKRLFGDMINYRERFAQSVANIQRVMTDEAFNDELLLNSYVQMVKCNRDNKKTFINALAELGFEFEYKEHWQ